MTEGRDGGDSGEEEMHPAKKAAWEGYRQYKEEMSRRTHVPTLRDLNVKTLIVIALVIVAMLMVKDAAEYVGGLLGWS